MQQSRKIVICFALVLILTGMAIFSYPFISNALENRHASAVVQKYDSRVDTLPQAEIDAMKETARTYNERQKTVVDGNSREGGTAREDVVDLIPLGDPLGYIRIPKIDLNLPIYEGTGEDVLASGIGHLTQTSYPLGGESTHCALSGHRGLGAAELFVNLDKLEVGDRFYLHVLDEVLAYQVDQILTVEPDETGALDIAAGEDLCTLVTCTPIGINSHRLLARGTRVPWEGEESPGDNSQYESIHADTAARRLGEIWPWLAFAALIVLGGEVFLMLMLGKRRKRKREDD